MLGDKVGSQSAFQFIPKVLDGVEFRAQANQVLPQQTGKNISV